MRTTLALLVATIAGRALLPAADKTPLTLADLLAWKQIQTPAVSNDGQWFAYKLVPNDGTSEVVLTHLPDGKEQKYSIGQVVRPNPYANGGQDPRGADGTAA